MSWRWPWPGPSWSGICRGLGESFSMGGSVRSDPCALTDSLRPTKMASARPRIPSIRTLTATDFLDEVFGDIDMLQPLVPVEHQQGRDELEDDPSNSRFRTG